MGRTHVRLVVLVALALFLTPLAISMASGTGELRVLFEDWLMGREAVLVKLNIDVPRAAADYCVVEVFRFPTPFNPTKTGSLELVAVKRVSPSSRVTVASLVENAPPVKYVRDSRGALRVAYREPQEYLVSVKCVKLEGRTARLVASHSRIVEVKPTKPVSSVKVELGRATVTPAKPANSVGVESLIGGGSSLPTPTCTFQHSLPGYVGTPYTDECVAETLLATLNSVPGLETYFKTLVVPRPSAMYLSAYKQECSEWDIFSCECRKWMPWREAGKKLVPTLSGSMVGPVGGGRQGVALANVVYKLYWWPGDQDGFAGVCYDGPSYTLYPAAIKDLTRVASTGFYSQPPYPPSYAGAPRVGDVEIGFTPARETKCKTGVSTSISFCYGLGCVSLNIDVYKAGRNDNEYTTPVLVVRDVSGRSSPWYYWWYKDNDPMSYEVQFYGERS